MPNKYGNTTSSSEPGSRRSLEVKRAMIENQTSLMATLTWGSPGWIVPIAVGAGLVAVLVVLSYSRRGMPASARSAAALLKLAAVAALAVCALEPLFNGTRPRPGANSFLVAVDNSHSLAVTDRPGRPSRGEQLRNVLRDDAPWLARLGQDFDVRRYFIDTRLRSTDSYRILSFDGQATALRSSLATIAQQFRGRPVAGVLLVTDGNATDWNEAAIDWNSLPPVYPVLVGEEDRVYDLAVSRLTVTQTNFETTPVTVVAEISADGMSGESVVLQLLDSAGLEVQRHVGTLPDDRPFVHRFQFRPEQPGVSFYRVRAFALRDEAAVLAGKPISEATVANNSRLAIVDRGRGPYRILYVAGRPNWEFKFLRRAVADDVEVELVGLLRIAKREAKFSFRGRESESTNPLFRGFGNQADQTAEQYDEPVLIRFGTQDQTELREGFPKTAEQLFEYHALILDDVEAEFFTRDQMSLIQRFASQRGGAVLMLGGQESFGSGEYARTPLGELLPVYFDKATPALPAGDYRWSLARDGWLQPWIRLRSTEAEEEKRLAEMPSFRTVNATAGLKPGATVLVSFLGSGVGGEPAMHPALVVQPFGQGRTAAILAGDLWRWGMRRADSGTNDLAKGWRQTIRWLVADVPGRVTIQSHCDVAEGQPTTRLAIQVRDAMAEPLDNADVKVSVSTPDGKQVAVDVNASEKTPGEYETEYVPRMSGPYQARVTVTAPDGSAVGEAMTGFSFEPETEEFRTLRPNRQLLERIAERTGGEVLEAAQLDRFVSSLPNRRIPITEPWVYPVWHQWPLLALAIACLVGEWGLRRWKGWP